MGVAAQNGTSTQIPGSSEQPADSLPTQWDLQACIDYALQQNITIRKNRLNAESAQVDVKTARAALFPTPFGQCEPACRESPEERDKHHH